MSQHLYHEMKLQERYFRQVASKEKIYELRRFDEKRKRVRVGDAIKFSCGDRYLIAEVTEIKVYSNFTNAIIDTNIDDLIPGISSVENVIFLYNELYGEDFDGEAVRFTLSTGGRIF